MKIFWQEQKADESAEKLLELENRIAKLERETTVRVYREPIDIWNFHYQEITLHEAILLVLRKLNIHLKYVAGTPETVILEKNKP